MPQKDGRCYVVEKHTDSLGNVYPIEYGPVGKIDYQTVMDARAVQMGIQIADQEADALWSNGVWKAPTQQTGAELAARFRAAYKDASQLRAAQMAWWLIERITAGDITDAQARNAFGLTLAQYTPLKARMTTLHDQYAAVMAARGE